MDSKQGKINNKDWKAMGRGALVWFSPVLLMWISSVLGTIQQDSHIFAWQDLIPKTYTIGGMIAWLIGRFQDYLLKLQAGK